MDKPVFENKKIKPDFQTQTSQADIALRVKGYSKAFDELKLFDNVDWDIAAGERWALVGPNGCGKTTLLRDIIEHGKWEDSIIRIGPSLTCGYCAQQQEVLDGDNTVFDELMSIKDAVREQVLGILARFLFNDEEVNKKVSQLSGGERNRLQLARLMLTKPNFLILDEPTNHLDIPTREAVEEALADFAGTILVVSHDRYFLDKIVDRVAEVHGRKLRLFTGNFTDFWQSQKTSAENVSGRVASRGKNRLKQDKQKTKAGRETWLKRKSHASAERKTRKRLAELEEHISQAEQEKKQLEEQIAEAFGAGDHAKGTELSNELRRIAGELELVYENWNEAAEKLSEIE